MSLRPTFLRACSVLVATCAASFAFACGDSGSGGAGGSASTTNPTSTTGVATSGSGTTNATSSSNGTSGSNAASTTTSGSTGSGTGCNVPQPMYDGLGCLTFDSASEICGFDSDEAICEFAVGCGFSTDTVGQCKINCEQGSSSFCNDMTKTTCVIDSFCTQDCAKLATCDFIL